MYKNSLRSNISSPMLWHLRSLCAAQSTGILPVSIEQLNQIDTECAAKERGAPAVQTSNSDYAAAQRVWDEWRLSKESNECSFVRYFQERLNPAKAPDCA